MTNDNDRHSEINITSTLYNAIALSEDNRLIEHPIEKALTLEAIWQHSAHLHKDNASNLKIADIGGATGTYAFDLAEKGYEVHLRDISPGLLDIARVKQGKTIRGLASIEVGDAKAEDTLFSASMRGTFDIVLLLGPLYHLIHKEERLAALKNALNLLHSDGVLFAAFVSMNAHLRDIAVRDPERLITQREFYESYLHSGQYIRRGGERNAESYHAQLDEIEPLVTESGGILVEIVGVEGILGGGLDSSLARGPPEVLQAWLPLLSRLGREKSNLGNADHWLAAVRKA